jgi:hypothetical protein
MRAARQVVAAASAAAHRPARRNPAQSAGLDCEARLRAQRQRYFQSIQLDRLIHIY